jgi:hypothetical protein
LTTLEQRGHRDNLKKQQRKAYSEFLKQQKANSKNLSKSDAKKALQDELANFTAQQKKETEELEKKLATQKQEEEEMMVSAQKNKCK